MLDSSRWVCTAVVVPPEVFHRILIVWVPAASPATRCLSIVSVLNPAPTQWGEGAYTSEPSTLTANPTWNVLVQLHQMLNSTSTSLALASVKVVVISGISLIVALVGIGTERGAIAHDVGTSLIGAGMISVLVLPLFATAIVSRESSRPDDVHLPITSR